MTPTRTFAVLLALLMVALLATPGQARQTGAVAPKVAERVGLRFGMKALGESVEAFAKRIESFALVHGDDGYRAVEKVGPRTFHIAEQAGKHGSLSVRMMARHGDEGVAFIASKPKALGLVAKHGDDCGSVFIKHAGIVDDVVELGGGPAVKALGAVGGQSGRRLAMLTESGELAAMGRTPELFAVITKFSDAAMAFIWKNKAALVVASSLAAFLKEPELFISGAKEFAIAATETVTEHVVAPIVQIPVKAADRAMEGTNWTVVTLVVFGVVSLGGFGCLWHWWQAKRVIPQLAKGGIPCGGINDLRTLSRT